MKVFVDPRVRRAFERQIVRAYTLPSLFNPELLPMKRTFLFYGQPGSGLEDAIYSLLSEYNLEHQVLEIGRDPAPLRKAFESFKTTEVPLPVLWIRNGHLLQYHRELFVHSLDLAKSADRSHLFVIVTGEEIPEESHPFYEQFDMTVPTGLPNKDYYRSLMEYYFTRWESHWKYSKMKLRADDFEWLSICCDYCTPRDVERFVQKVFNYVQEHYPEEKVDITRELLEDKNNLFMYESLGVSGVYCITDRDTRAMQLKFDPAGATDALDVNQAAEREKKRSKKNNE